MARTQREMIARLLSRAGFGASPAEIDAYASLGYAGAVELLVNYEQVPDNVDTLIGRPGYTPVVAERDAASYAPNYVIGHARARWLFRMLYTQRPLQEKMALFWHNHFATGWSKIVGLLRDTEATRLMAAVPEEDPAKQLGQIEMFRRMALGSFYDILLAASRDAAMLYWLDGRLNTKSTPQENFGREVMELFTFGLTYTEADVKAAAKVFTGWNLRSQRVGTITRGNQTVPVFQYDFLYDSRQHSTEAKTFSFAVYPNGAQTIAAREATRGLQDGLDFLLGLVAHPGTATRLATKLYQFFVNDVDTPSTSAVATIAGWLQKSEFNMRTVMGQLFMSDLFLDEANWSSRYRWPVEHVTGMLKALGPGSTPLDVYVPLLAQMNELLFDPPSVEGYKGGATWISSGTMLARANAGSAIARLRGTDLVSAVTAQGVQTNPTGIVDFVLGLLGITTPDAQVRADLVKYMTSGAGANWTGSANQLRAKVPGLVHMISGTPDYTFI